MTGCKPSKTRTPSGKTPSPDDFHEALHKDLGKSYDKDSQTPAHRAQYQGRVHRPGGSHDLSWATAKINPRIGHIKIDLAINFQNGGVEKQAEFERLRSLAKDGINRFWSRTIKVDKKQVCVKVSVSNRCGPQALPINLMVDPDPDDPARGRNSGLTFLTARIVHKPQFYSTPAIADQAFQIEAAHELGHSVLMNAGGVGLSWSHKGTTHLWQQANGSAPSHPPSGGIDLMKYYRKDGSYASVTDQFRRKKATEKDIKRLIWGARFQWIN